MADPVSVRTEGRIGVICIDRPDSAGAITIDMRRTISAALADLAGASELRVIVFRNAASGQFVAGADLPEMRRLMARDDAMEEMTRIHRAFISSIVECPLPIIAEIGGPCIGLGISIAAACDIRIASSAARFAVPAARHGIAYPEDDLLRLERASNRGFAVRLVMLDDTLDSAAARDAGFLHQVSRPAELAGDAESMAARVAALSPLTIRSAKQALRHLL